MPFIAPKLKANGRIDFGTEEKAPLEHGERCLICFERDPAKYANCQDPDCWPVYDPEKEPDGFVPARPMVSAFELARRMRAKALSLEWDDDELRDRLLRRARQLEQGDTAEVQEEDF